MTWKQDEAGNLLWANKAYLDASEGQTEPSRRNGWPPRPLFDAASLRFNNTTQRVKSIQGVETWFDCSYAQTSAGKLFFAKEVDDVIKAESNLRDFVQTVSKSFASLHIGIAIFDEKQKLTLFNPAMANLTNLSADFLASKPSLRILLDRLRNDRMIPEPKNYKYWRNQILALGEDQSDEGYEETWSLPSGRTYRIIVRPHSNRSIAMHIEDISTEISLTRHFRAELSLSQAIIDEIPEAIAVFSSAGPLTLSNAGYADIWGIDPSTTLGEFNITEATNLWRKACKPSDVWARLTVFASQTEAREGWSDHIQTHDGIRLLCSVSAIQGGSTSVRFRRLANILPDAEPQLMQSNIS
nr:PAS-domain containing protein [Cochlodiniinecator piscidefendens]